MNRLDVNRNFAENMEKERVRLGLSQKQMADELDISLSAYKRIINLSNDKIDLFMTYKLYLLTGKFACEYMGINDTYINVKQKMQGLSPAQMSFIADLVDFERDFRECCENIDDYITVFIPTGNMEDGMVYDSSNVEKVNISNYRRKYGAQIGCGIKITSNHLHPVYNLGDILLISKRPIRDGDTGVFVNKENGCAYIRKFHQTSPCFLEPLNNYGENIYVNSNDKNEMDKWIKFGTVIAKIR